MPNFTTVAFKTQAYSPETAKEMVITGRPAQSAAMPVLRTQYIEGINSNP